MWHERTLKIIPAVLFLFCVLEIFEMILIINNLNKVEKLEAKIENNLKMSEHITILLDENLVGMDLEHCKDKKIKIK
ncbi:hypothetical protein [Helicobacter pylori]|uniref:hypothetical protein n=1 Tax=Helicobacter pylori TaxID=210 RepID=UPI0039E093F1